MDSLWRGRFSASKASFFGLKILAQLSLKTSLLAREKCFDSEELSFRHESNIFVPLRHEHMSHKTEAKLIFLSRKVAFWHNTKTGLVSINVRPTEIELPLARLTIIAGPGNPVKSSKLTVKIIVCWATPSGPGRWWTRSYLSVYSGFKLTSKVYK